MTESDTAANDFKEDNWYDKEFYEPNQGNHRTEDPLELCQCMGCQEHQRRLSEVQRIPHHSEEWYRNHKQDQGSNPGGLHRGRIQAEGQRQECACTFGTENFAPWRRFGEPGRCGLRRQLLYQCQQCDCSRHCRRRPPADSWPQWSI